MNPFKVIKSLFTSAPSLSPRECAARIRAGDAILIDVREPGEWASGVADQAVLLPLGDLTGARAQWKPFLAANAGKELLVYCAAGGRSGIAARILTSEGFRAANTGGFSDWFESGWPVAKPSRKLHGK
jgi:rhodanese-related sulfurtransferase